MDYNKKKTIKDVDVKNKKVLVRVDFNVPLDSNQNITDDNRIVAALPTIKYLVDNQAKVILFSHLGRIKTEDDKKTKSLKPIAKRLGELMKKDIIFVPVTEGKPLEEAINNMKNGEVLLVENTRFEDVVNGEVVKRESKNDPTLGKYWASLGEVFINDAFGTAHRAHASNVGIASNSKVSALGFLVEDELKNLAEGIDNPKKPFIAILGGAKVSDKIGVIANLLNKVDKILIGGGMAYTFFAAQGHKVGKSLLEEDKIDDAKHYLEIGKGKIILPVDSANAPAFEDVTPSFSDTNVDMPSDVMGLDIGPKTIELYKKELAGAKTVVWNGPMGVTEFKNFEKGTLEVGQAIANLKGAFTLIGGGDSAAAAKKLGLADKFSWISTGGGASLEYMEGKPLPGIEAIQNK